MLYAGAHPNSVVLLTSRSQPIKSQLAIFAVRFTINITTTTALWPTANHPNSLPSPPPQHQRKLKDLDPDDVNDKAFIMVSAIAAICFSQSPPFPISAKSLVVQCHSLLIFNCPHVSHSLQVTNRGAPTLIEEVMDLPGDTVMLCAFRNRVEWGTSNDMQRILQMYQRNILWRLPESSPTPAAATSSLRNPHSHPNATAVTPGDKGTCLGYARLK